MLFCTFSIFDRALQHLGHRHRLGLTCKQSLLPPCPPSRDLPSSSSYREPSLLREVFDFMTCTATETAGPHFPSHHRDLWRHISLSQILAPKDFGSKIRELVRGNLNILKNFPFYASFEAKPPPAVTSGLSAFLRLNSLGVASCLQNEMGRMKLWSSQTKKSWLSNVAREQQYWFVKAHICVDRTSR